MKKRDLDFVHAGYLKNKYLDLYLVDYYLKATLFFIHYLFSSFVIKQLGLNKHSFYLVTEIERIKNKDDKKPSPKKYDETDFIDTYSQKMPKVESVLKVPVDIYPQVNFVGRIIGPGGSTLKGIQEVTQTRISVLGKGSQRDKKKVKCL